MAGSVLGSLGAWAVLRVGLALEQPLLKALGHAPS